MIHIQLMCVLVCVVCCWLPSCYDPIVARIKCGRMGVLVGGGERRKFFPGILCCCSLCCAARLLCKHNGRHLLHLGKQGTRTLTPSPGLLAVNCAKWCCLSCLFSRWPTSKVQPFTRWLLLTASLLFCDCGHCAGRASSPPAAWPFPLKGWKPWKWRIEQFYECSSQLFSWLAPATGGSEEI